MSKLNNIDPPKDERSFGEVTFNYADHDGRFVIGIHPWAFETRWSHSGSGSAHLYNDPVGIAGVAIAEGVSSISQVTPAVVAAASFNSRDRSPVVGQIALLQNTEGFYAAVELLEVISSKTPSERVMRLRFAIATDHSTDFSPFASKFDDRQALVDQLLAAVKDAERAIQAVPIDEDIGCADYIGIGHNHPPAEGAITQDDRAKTLEALAIASQEAVTASPSPNIIYAARKTIAQIASKVAKWLGGKMDAAVNEFAKTIGKAAGVLTVAGLTAWLTLQTKLTFLVEILGKFTG